MQNSGENFLFCIRERLICNCTAPKLRYIHNFEILYAMFYTQL